LSGAIDPDNTLLILDEIQASNRALASLKYFNEEMPGIFLVCAGSLLGIAVDREDYSAPVGNVDTLALYPMGFDEFLRAIGEELMISDIQECYQKNERYFLHDKALELFRAYLLVGGMPEAVQEYCSSKDFSRIQDIQLNILNLYLADMAKYAKPFETARIREVWESIPAQLTKNNKKFQYKTRCKNHSSAF
jgi:predicted AAA+ superfamily ATPase